MRTKSAELASLADEIERVLCGLLPRDRKQSRALIRKHQEDRI